MRGNAPFHQDRLTAGLDDIGPDAFGPGYSNHSLEIYKNCLETADRLSERRAKANSFFSR